MGLKKYGDEPDYALAYADFLSHLNGLFYSSLTIFVFFDTNFILNAVIQAFFRKIGRLLSLFDVRICWVG